MADLKNFTNGLIKNNPVFAQVYRTTKGEIKHA
ncbi:hypothetical protein X929_05230 [Petrotoga olearia DSM 13574]|uniref:Uncharacterized protein n=1 Tax=Petrotoga olearia DSM 13574 TaxID=1122955 RepID=A0A2K1P1B0_9BACT|nr:hypothetical protein X929_05230 [Petrotoga olearia DSM 13574]